MTLDGRLLVVLGLLGVSGAAAVVRGSRGVVRCGRKLDPKAPPTFSWERDRGELRLLEAFGTYEVYQDNSAPRGRKWRVTLVHRPDDIRESVLNCENPPFGSPFYPTEQAARLVAEADATSRRRALGSRGVVRAGHIKTYAWETNHPKHWKLVTNEGTYEVIEDEYGRWFADFYRRADQVREVVLGSWTNLEEAKAMAEAHAGRRGSRGVVRRGRATALKRIHPGAIADLVKEVLSSYNAEGCMEVDANEVEGNEDQIQFHGIDSNDDYFEHVYQVVSSKEEGPLAFRNDELGIGFKILRSKP